MRGSFSCPVENDLKSFITICFHLGTESEGSAFADTLPIQGKVLLKSDSEEEKKAEMNKFFSESEDAKDEKSDGIFISYFPKFHEFWPYGILH